MWFHHILHLLCRATIFIILTSLIYCVCSLYPFSFFLQISIACFSQAIGQQQCKASFFGKDKCYSLFRHSFLVCSFSVFWRVCFCLLVLLFPVLVGFLFVYTFYLTDYICHFPHILTQPLCLIYSIHFGCLVLWYYVCHVWDAFILNLCFTHVLGVLVVFHILSGLTFSYFWSSLFYCSEILF